MLIKVEPSARNYSWEKTLSEFSLAKISQHGCLCNLCFPLLLEIWVCGIGIFLYVVVIMDHFPWFNGTIFLFQVARQQNKLRVHYYFSNDKDDKLYRILQ
jgi:hypothetical protein